MLPLFHETAGNYVLSLLSCDFARIAEEIELIRSGRILHCDIMDGHFVPNHIGPPSWPKYARPRICCLFT